LRVQEARWDKRVTVRAEDYIFFYGKGKGNHQLGAGYFVQQVREWGLLKIGCHMFGFERSLVPFHFFNVLAPSEEQSDVTKDSFVRN